MFIHTLPLEANRPLQVKVQEGSVVEDTVVAAVATVMTVAVVEDAVVDVVFLSV